ncbi:MAG: hypothetical protein O2975_02585 [Proteobacteria bacterium]|nr:hypothetical protein [Pseudomonadota bacterium]
MPIQVISQDAFHAIHRVMLGHAFAIHNQYGWLLDEKIYKVEPAHRCMAAGVAAVREVLIRVCHGAFSKDYFIDLLLEGSTVTEGKCAQAIVPGQWTEL